MAGFIYAIPNAGIITEAKLKEVGLAGIFEGIIYSQRQTFQGPGGGDCMLICIGDDVKQLYFRPDEQTWQKSLNGKYWIGFVNNNKPTEQSLKRGKQLAGHKIELMDGGKWLIPVARIITGGSALPQSLILGKNGEVLTEALPQYAEFSTKAEKLWEDFLNEYKKREEPPRLTNPERLNFAIEALGWNYHIGVEESNLLKLITTANLYEILEAVMDITTLVKVAKQMKDEKKKEDTPTEDG